MTNAGRYLAIFCAVLGLLEIFVLAGQYRAKFSFNGYHLGMTERKPATPDERSPWNSNKRTTPLDRRNATNTRFNGTSDVITLFTTIRDSPYRVEIHHRLLRNWATLRLRRVLFVPKPEVVSCQGWIDEANALGWEVRILEYLRHDLPVVPHMFQEIINTTHTPFVAYVNSDILFDHSLFDTLEALNSTFDVENERILVVGRHRNANISTFNLGTGSDLEKISALGRVGPYHMFSQDYFIVSRTGLPWNDMPKFVVGRNGYDNWLVAKAQDWGVNLVDASSTLLAVHQVGVDGFQSGSSTVPTESREWNHELIEGFNFIRGRTDCAGLITEGVCRRPSEQCNQDNDIRITSRTTSNFCKTELTY